MTRATTAPWVMIPLSTCFPATHTRAMTPLLMITVSDNVLQDGDILESRYAVTRRNRTIHARMREYLYEIKHHPCLVTSILPVGDGVAVSVKRETAE